MSDKSNELVPTGKQPSELFDGMREADEKVLSAARIAIDESRHQITRAVNSSMVATYWRIGKEIVEATGDRAAYGKHLIAYLSEHLTAEYGRGFGERTLRDARQFYRTFPIWHEVRAKLGWAQYRRIMRLESAEAREFYASECEASNWSEAELKRNIDTNLYDRLLHTQARLCGSRRDSRAEMVRKDATTTLRPSLSRTSPALTSFPETPNTRVSS